MSRIKVLILAGLAMVLAVAFIWADSTIHGLPWHNGTPSVGDYTIFDNGTTNYRTTFGEIRRTLSTNLTDPVMVWTTDSLGATWVFDGLNWKKLTAGVFEFPTFNLLWAAGPQGWVNVNGVLQIAPVALGPSLRISSSSSIPADFEASVIGRHDGIEKWWIGTNGVIHSTGLQMTNIPNAQVLKTDASGIVGAGTVTVTNLYQMLTCVADGGGSPVPAMTGGYITVPWNCTIISCTIMADVSGSIEFRVWRTNSADASFPPTSAGAIGTNSLSSDAYNVDSTLNNWTKTLDTGDVVGFNIPSAATSITRATLQLKVAP